MSDPSGLRVSGSAQPTYVAGIVNFRSYSEVDRCLRSLDRQTQRPIATIVVDHDADLEQRRRCVRNPERVRWVSRPNAGYAAGANAILDWTAVTTPTASFTLLLNPDVVLDKGYAESLIREMMGRPVTALASGKLLRPDGCTLDSAGIRMARHHRPIDRGSDELDRRQFENCEFVFAASGAALMIRRQALSDLSVNGEVFDEDFFAYHEETDLAWRAQLLGWKSLYVPDARAVHQRGWRRGQRFGIDPRIRRHAFKNRYLEMVKNEQPMTFLRDLPAIAGWEVLRLGYSLIRDRTLLRAYPEAVRLLPRAWAKRRIIQQRAASLR
jgi:GT2 family glycosyltransferase